MVSGYDQVLDSEEQAKNLGALIFLILGTLAIVGGVFFTGTYFELSETVLKNILYTLGGIFIICGIFIKMSKSANYTYDYV